MVTLYKLFIHLFIIVVVVVAMVAAAVTVVVNWSLLCPLNSCEH